MKIAIGSSPSYWLQEHPAVFRFIQILIWMSDHPIISVVIVLFAIALIWQLIKLLGYLIEIGVRSLMQAPIKLLHFLLGIGAKSLNAVGDLALKPLAGNKKTVPALPPASSQPVLPDKKQRLAEISSRLEVLQKEQNELLQEVAAIMASDKINLEV